jgi:hypothetical protein
MGRIIWQLVALIVLSGMMTGCSTKVPTPAAKIYREMPLARPGTYELKFLLSGQGTLTDYFSREKAQNAELRDFDLSKLEKLVRNAYPQLYHPVPPGSPLCNLDINFKHCKGIELLADIVVYADDTVVAHSYLFYHVRIRLERDHPNFYTAVKTQRDRGDFTLPPEYEVGALVEAIQKALPILQEIAADYGKYIKDGNQEIEIELTLEENREKTAAKKTDENISNAAQLSGKAVVSVLQGASFFANLTVSSLYSGGKTFWEVLKEEKDFDLYKRTLALDRVDFSYTGSFTRNLTKGWRNLVDPASDILIRDIVIRLRDKEPKAPPSGSVPPADSIPPGSVPLSSSEPPASSVLP